MEGGCVYVVVLWGDGEVRFWWRKIRGEGAVDGGERDEFGVEGWGGRGE